VWIVSRHGYGVSAHGLDRPGDAEYAATVVGHVRGAGGWREDERGTGTCGPTAR
jgi:hypothetical protein